MALFKLIRPEDALEAWTKFWAGADKGLTALSKQMPLKRHPDERERLHKLRDRFIRLRDRAPSALDCLLEELPRGIYDEEAETLAALAGVCHDWDLAVQLFLRLVNKKISSKYFRTKLLEKALELSRDDPGCFGDVVEFLQGYEYRDDEVFDRIVAYTGQVLRKLGLSSFLLQLLKEGHFRRLLECGFKQLLVRKIKADEPIEPATENAAEGSTFIERSRGNTESQTLIWLAGRGICVESIPGNRVDRRGSNEIITLY